MVDKEILDRIERLEEKANMKEQTFNEAIEEFRQAKENLIRNIGKPFDVFLEKCEKAGIEFSKEEKVEELPKLGESYWYKDSDGDILKTEFTSFRYDLFRKENLCIFKTEYLCEKYYSIKNTIKSIVNELGRPTWDDFEDIKIRLYVVSCDFYGNRINEEYCEGLYRPAGIFPYCKDSYLDQLIEKVSQEDLLWAFKKSMRLV